VGYLLKILKMSLILPIPKGGIYSAMVQNVIKEIIHLI
jgi:hypothetical protein